ncbi:MAG: HmuY family protein [Spirochaetaceae bacterium]|jgi:hypothetical protein|nr:HmuY family protein [Spirochaetaceae bacterium]
MYLFSQNTFWGAVIAAATLAVLTGACNTEADPPGGSDPGYPQAVVRVDDTGANRAVFIDFSAENPIAAEVPHDFFDLAIDSNGHIIANSGSYGSGVLVYKTNRTDITEDLSTLADRVKEYTFKEGTELYGCQERANPFAGEISPLAKGSGTVYLIETAPGNRYKMTFNMFGMGGVYRFMVVKGLEGTEATEITGSLKGLINDPENTYGSLFLDLDAEPPGALNTSGIQLVEGAPPIPVSRNWDLLCTRTDEPQEGGGLERRSSILLNTYREVTAYTAPGVSLRDLLRVDASLLSAELDAIGCTWYSAEGSPSPVYQVQPNAYVVRTVEGNFAKFMSESYTGPGGEGFYMAFSYFYGDASGTFSR